MRNELITKQRKRRRVSYDLRGMLAAMLLASLLFATGAKATAMTGTYTIDPSGLGDYSSFKAAVTDLTSNGVSGPVLFNVIAATYSEAVTVGKITGASPANTITFRGAGRGKTILSSTGTIVTVSGYTVFDQMTIVTSGSVLIKATKSKECSFTNCDLTGATGGTGNLITGSSSDSLTIYNCEISGGGEALVMDVNTQGSSAFGYLRCSHNRFVNQNFECIDIENDFMDSVAFNTFDSSGGTMDEPVGAEEPNGFVFWGNKVYTVSNEGVDIFDPDEYQVSGQPTQSYFVNNWIVISDQGSNQYDGAQIELYQTPNFTFAFNTFVNDGAQDDAVDLDFDNSSNVTFANNIFYGTYSGYNGQFFLDYYNSTFKLYDGNDLYCTASTSSNPLCIFSGSTSFTQFYDYSDYSAAMQGNGWEFSGTNIAPPFASLGLYPYDLHMSTTSAAPKGVSGVGITTDIDQKGRFSPPTVGASESYYGITNNNAGVTALISPVGQCPGTVTVSVQVSDLGLNAITSGGTIAWTWDGVPQTSVNYTAIIPLYGQTTITLGTKTITAGVSYALKAWPTLTNTKANAGSAMDTLNIGVLAALGSGTYTIDGSKASSGSNFKSFTDAVTAINAGICGPVIFNVSSASYNEAITIGPIVGASAINTVLFRGAGRNKTTLTNSGTPITMSGSDYVGFDQMTISTTGSGNTVKDGSTMACAFTNDNLIATTYSNGSTGDVVKTSGSTRLKIYNCRLVGGQYSYYAGSNFDTFTNNRIIAMGNCSIYASNVTGNDYEYNVVDSVDYGSPQYGMYSNSESGGNWNGNTFNFRDASGVPVNVQQGLEIDNPNSVATLDNNSVPLYWAFTNNIAQCTSSEEGLDYDVFQSNGPDIFAFNTISINNGYSSNIDIENNAYNSQIFANNILIFQNAQDEGVDFYVSSPGFISGIPDWDNADGSGGNALYDGDDIVSTGTGSNWTWGYGSNGPFNSYADYQNYCHPQGWELYSTGTTPNFLNTGNNPLYLDTTKAGPPAVNICTPVSNAYINYPGVQYDVTGRKRCALFPTAGAYEDPFGKAPVATKIFLPTSGVYPGSPATIYQSHTASSPAIYTWYVMNSNYASWTPVSTSVDLYYNGWTTGTNSLKLVTQSCTGTDADSINITVNAPTAIPVTDFISSANTVQQNASVQFTDLSTNGPTQWSWAITPDSITVGSLKFPTTTLLSNSLSNTQDPSVMFLYPGYYEVCLTAYNTLGKGGLNCKPNYINVVPATNLTSTLQTVTTPTGYIFDNGGPDNNYTAIGAPYIQSVLIAPCADSIYLTFSQFDTKCGTDFVKIYNGSSPAGTQLNTVCNSGGSGANGLGPGFNGGPTNVGCASYCIPDVNRPDTFRAGKTMFLTMDCYLGGAPGFAAYYWVKPNNDTRVVPSFTTASGDTVCAGQIVNYINTTTINPADVPSFEWDLDGDLTDGFECTGTCATALWPYFLPGIEPVTLIATNCGGADTIVKNISIISPPKPVAAFTASVLAPTTSDIDVFTSNTVQCVDDYKWSITPSAGNTGGSAPTYVNKTSDISASPQVTFPDTGYYDVSLYVDNASATQSSTLPKLKYIHVRDPYCTPAVASLSTGIGISRVVFNTIDNYTMPQATSGYLNFTPDASLGTNIAIGATYPISISRDPTNISSAINRDVYIDWNQDGLFTGAGEIVAQDSDSKSQTFNGKVVVPVTAKLGATVMRVATNLYLYPNVPCGPNQFGEYEDYRVYVTPYDILPVITLKGVSGLNDTIRLEQGYPYKEPGDSASSYLYGNITKDILVTSKIVGGSGAFSNVIPGAYVFSYNVADSAGNKAITKYRVVEVTKDKTPPALNVALSTAGSDTIFQEVSTASIPPNLDPALSSYVIRSIDLVDGDLTKSVFIDSSLVQTEVVGVYPVTYTSTDYSNNKATVIRYVDVIDTIAPLLILKGGTPTTVEVYTPFVDPGVTITVPNNYLTQAQVTPYLHVVSSVDDSVLGTYKITYSLTDTFGNKAATVVRIVNVIDNIAPVITLNGPLTDSIPVFSTYADPGYTVSDNYTKTAIVPKVTGTFYSGFAAGTPATKIGGGHYAGQPGVGPAYTIIYTATDGAGNTSTITRTIEVYDAVPPDIELIGDPSPSVCRWFPYVDLGYTLSDNYDDAASMVANGLVHEIDDINSSGGTNVAYHTMYVQYTAMDQSHNFAKTDYRYITVIDAGQGPCQSGIEPNLDLDKYISIFPNPSSGIFTLDANLPAVQNVRISVMNMLGQEIAVVHNGNLSNNSFRIDLSTQSSGVYFLNVVTDNQALTKRIEITK